MLATYFSIGVICVAWVLITNANLRYVFSDCKDWTEVLACVLVLAWHVVIWPVDILRAFAALFADEEET